MHFLFAVVLFVLVAQPAVATEPTWTSLKTKAGISLSYRYNPELEVKASAFYPGKPESFLLLLKDTKSVRRWLKQSEDAKLLEGSTESHWKVYTRFQSVWPVSPRDMVTCADVIRKMKSLLVQISDCSDLVPETKDYVRIRDVKAVWTLTPKDQGFDMQYQGSAHPGGELPKWLVKQLTLSSLRASFVAFKTELKRPAYQAKTTQANR
ncbi:START domain-containing protein [Rheinheimera sp. 1928-s]|uniref:START domain-containing protein n=1 Tax=Rheinheimera sp. 1928-s TaxID=3033803 RepID=UPI0026377E42|nr:START domain-containing protein [Rheinheimera sp. 1928-s]MDF3127182.1 START domain-containing protein [Rheinheimera sp. 1928-s]